MQTKSNCHWHSNKQTISSCHGHSNMQTKSSSGDMSGYGSINSAVCFNGQSGVMPNTLWKKAKWKQNPCFLRLRYLLSICFLHQGRPKFIRLNAVDKYQLTPVCREKIINEHLFPSSEMPEVEAEHARIPAILEALARRDNSVKQAAVFGCRQTGHRSNKPAVSCEAMLTLQSCNSNKMIQCLLLLWTSFKCSLFYLSQSFFQHVICDD